MLVGAVERVNLNDIATQYGTYCSKFPSQTGDLFSIRTLRVAELGEQTLGLLLLSRELGHDGVVVDLCLHLTVLVGELLIFVFHFFLVECSKLLHVRIFLALLMEVEIKNTNTCEKQDNDHYEWNENFLIHFVLKRFYYLKKLYSLSVAKVMKLLQLAKFFVASNAYKPQF